MSSVRKDNCFFFSKLFYQRMTSFVLPHWFTSAFHLIGMFILLTMFLLTLPISCFDGLIRRHFVLYVKFSLWSFMVMNAGLS